MTTLNICLTFNGNCLEAFNFYKSAFGGDFLAVRRFSDMPPQEGMPAISEEEKDLIMHMSLPISKDSILFGNDTSGSRATDYQQGNNFTISVRAESKKEADRLFTSLSEDGQVTMQMQDTFWGDYFGSLTDRFGIAWMIRSSEENPI